MKSNQPLISEPLWSQSLPRAAIKQVFPFFFFFFSPPTTPFDSVHFVYF